MTNGAGGHTGPPGGQQVPPGADPTLAPGANQNLNPGSYQVLNPGNNHSQVHPLGNNQNQNHPLGGNHPAAPPGGALVTTSGTGTNTLFNQPGTGVVGNHTGGNSLPAQAAVGSGQNLNPQSPPPNWAAEMQAMQDQMTRQQDQMRTMMTAFNQLMSSVAQGNSVPNITGWAPPLQQQQGGLGAPVAQPLTSGQAPAGQPPMGSSSMAMPAQGQPFGSTASGALLNAPPSIPAIAVAGSLPAAPALPTSGDRKSVV